MTDGSSDMAADRRRLDMRVVPSQNHGDMIFAAGQVYMRNVELTEVDHTCLWPKRDTAEARLHTSSTKQCLALL
ncbi:hypothetical protein DWB77_07327 [Streptomyces hundungensis]|uniref:Uncharacterized protein n=1 Tax=Streptomyces hundungensis TaxID=1077946 RepID=A0A387HQ07_9ACTN|nr:hypothetical protein [Streptomyces hundungensis]AYG85111.1 hypothetical protein DWB77_07327 [Streptomyces hundungensis]